MSKRILDLEARSEEAKLERNEAIREYRILRERTTKTIQSVASAFVADFGTESRIRRDRVADGASLENYLDWLLLASELRTRELCKYMDGDARHLALIEMRILIANHTVCAIQKEATRLRQLEAWNAVLIPA